MDKKFETANVVGQGIDKVGMSSFFPFSTSRCGSDTQGCVNTRRKTMKKLMIAATAAFCATVSFAELASANVVGYSTTALQAGFKAAGASFISIGKDGCNLTEIVPTGFDKTTGGVQIQLLNNAGVTTTTYKYYKGGRGTYATDGWYDGTTLITADNDVTFAPGDGLWIYGADGYSFQTSGEVKLSNVTRDLKTGFTMFSNPFPMDLKLTNITPAGFDKTTGGVQIQLLNNAGVTTTTYKYYKGGRGTYATDGWYDGTTLITADNDVTFAPGDGLWVYGADGYTITFSVGTASAE